MNQLFMLIYGTIDLPMSYTATLWTPLWNT